MHKLQQFTAIIEREENLYVALCPELDIVSQGDTEEQANSWPQNPEHIKVASNLKPMLSGAPIRESYDIRVHALK